MIILHGTWLNHRPGQFFLWGESLQGDTRPKRRPKGLKATEHAWPFQIPLPTLHLALTTIPGVWTSQEGEISLGIPAGLKDLNDQLVSWRIKGFMLNPTQALSFLSLLPERNLISTEVTLGPDARFWSESAKFTLELLARERFVPSIQCQSGLDYYGLWLPVLEEAEDQSRFQFLCEAIPPVCRTAAAPGAPLSSPIPGNDLVTHFVQSVMDATIRLWLKDLFPRLNGNATDIGMAWLKSLISDTLISAATTKSTQSMGEFHDRVQNWLSQIHPDRNKGYRTCFRLKAPDRPKVNNTWTLKFFLQANDDPQIVVPASEVWQCAQETLQFQNRHFEHPQERLLSDLGTACRLYSPLEFCLKQRHPQACDLTTFQAYTFLRETSVLLKESGFGVLLPTWWGTDGPKDAGLGILMCISPFQTNGTRAKKVMPGLNAPVNYDWNLAIGNHLLSSEELKNLISKNQPLVWFKDRWIQLKPAEVQAALRFLKMKEGIREKPEMTLGQLMRIGLMQDSAKLPLPVVGIHAEGWVQEFWNLFTNKDHILNLSEPKSLKTLLRPYQKRGLSWLAFMRRWNVGVCLADDMGLGKTVQVIALLLHDQEKGQLKRPILLVAPMSVMGNWQRELARFAPSLSVYLHHDTHRLIGAAFFEAVANHDLVITSYALIHRDEELLSAVTWDTIILDEAQNIKNVQAKQTQIIRKFVSRHQIALTGTPLENRLSELWSIVSFLNPGYLGTYSEFQKRFATPIERYHDVKTANFLKSLIQPFILRRVKTDPSVIQDLPEKIERKIFCPLSLEQAKLYEEAVKAMMQKIDQTEGIERRGVILATLTRLKQICDHPVLLSKDEDPLLGRSGKLDRLVTMLDQTLSAGDRALIFTQFTEMGKLLKTHLESVFGLKVFFLHGSLSKAARESLIERFQKTSGPQIFILSLKAGGLGLNLTQANHVFHFDRWWNPAVENQATDRTFRIGQVQNVMVHKMICPGTLEERIDEMIESKKNLLESMVTPGERWLTELSIEQLNDILTLRTEAIEETTWDAQNLNRI